MKLSPIVAHLRADCPTFAQRVTAGIDWDAVVDSAHLALPAAYVIAAADVAGDNRVQTGVLQDMTDLFSVVVVLESGDERGQEANDALHEVRAELWRALVGWVPGAEYSPIEYVKGELLHISRVRTVYQYSFIADFQLGRNRAGEPAETWHERALDGLTGFSGVTVNMDCIDPADRNLQHPGPDGRIEVTFSGDVTP